MWITYNKLWKSVRKRYLNIFLYCEAIINRLLTTRADPKDLNFNKVYMKTHRGSGLLISKFAS